MRSKGRYAKIGALIIAGGLTVGVVAIVAQPFPGGPGGGGGFGLRGGRPGGGRMMQALYLERTWAQVCFELQITDAQLDQLRPIFQAAWDTRRQAAEAEADDLAARALALGQANQQIRAEIDNALNEVLTDDQLERWEELRQQPIFPGFGPGMGRPRFRGGQQQ